MYNTLYRTEIDDQDGRKFIDTFVGPNSIASAMMAVVRNYHYTLACRVALDLLIPQTRGATIKYFQTLTFTVYKTQGFAEGFLHTRFFRQLFETALDFFAIGVFWIVAKYKNKYIDPPPPIPTTTAAPTNSTTTAAPTNTTTTAHTSTPLSTTEHHDLGTSSYYNFELDTSSSSSSYLTSSTEDYSHINFEPFESSLYRSTFD